MEQMKFSRMLRRPLVLLYHLYWDIVARILNDKHYLIYVFKHRLGYKLNLDDPQSFNEKMNWLKLYDRNPIYTKMADKYTAKQIVSEIIGSEYVVPCFGKWSSFDEIDFASLPNQFVLKATGDSSGAIICRDKKFFDFKSANRRLTNSLKTNYFYRTREWPYKDIKPVIIADQFLDDQTGEQLRDYKFWCFNGEPKVMYCTIKAENIYENFYDMDFVPLDINHGYPRRTPEFEKPANFELMKTLARKLSNGISFVRIDFFNVNDRIYFGEFTFFDWAGLKKFKDYNVDLMVGKWLKLPENNKYNA